MAPRSLALVLAVAGAGCRPARPPIQPSGVDRFVDHPDRLTLPPPGAPEGPAPLAPERFLYLWDKAALQREWLRQEGGLGRTFRSPRLPFASLAEIDRIEITLSTDRPPAAATLLWNDQEGLSRVEQLRNRRELTLPVSQATLTIRGEEIFDGSWHEHPGAVRAFRYLLIRPPAKGKAAAIESVRIVPRNEALASRSSGRARFVIAGETRDALAVRTPGSLSYRTRFPTGAELTLGLASSNPEATLRYSVRVAVEGAGESLPLEGQHPPGVGWRDVRLPLASSAGKNARITLSAESDRPGTSVLWSSPRIAMPRDESGPPNVILYVLDALRADRLGLYGYAGKTSPFLDQLGARGIVFRRCYAAATWTKPSITSLMTSLYPQTHGVGGLTYTDALPDGVPTLADMLRDAGYVTAQFVANPMAGSLSNLERGFDYATGPLGLQAGPAGPERPKVRSDEINARVLPWLALHARDRFFVYIHSMDTHAPYADRATGGALARGGGGQESRDPYDAEIRANDASLRDLYEHLISLGLARTTLLVVTADHGESFGEHGVRGHGVSVYQEEARVPLIIAQDMLTPAVVDVPAHHLDLVPTILRRCGVRLEGRQLEGIDLLAADRGALPPRTLFVTRFAYPFDDSLEPAPDREWYAVVQGDWKLIVREPRDPGEPARPELYDVATDPTEAHDLGRGHPARVAQLSNALRGFLARQRARRTEFLARYPGPVTMGMAGSSPTVPASVLESLKSLGYIR
jgi:arylsulfatase A-like enzyme